MRMSCWWLGFLRDVHPEGRGQCLPLLSCQKEFTHASLNDAVLVLMKHEGHAADSNTCLLLDIGTGIFPWIQVLGR